MCVVRKKLQYFNNIFDLMYVHVRMWYKYHLQTWDIHEYNKVGGILL